MISSMLSSDLASTWICGVFCSISTGSRNSPGKVMSVTCRPACNTCPSRRNRAMLFLSLSHSAWELKSIQSSGLALPAVLNSMMPDSSRSRVIMGKCKITCCRSLRSFAVRKVNAILVSCLDTGGSKTTWRNWNWKPGSMYGTDLKGSSMIDTASVRLTNGLYSFVGANILYFGSLGGDSLGSFMQQIRTSTSRPGNICLGWIMVRRKTPLSVSYTALLSNRGFTTVL
mmetsp:Transcript_65264/g.199668  ORF Transcript_65264/g.199668 Transcript_65264/m.199668 type:complete len:228 (-) Transcript_65264:363-1046(-)